MTNIFRVRYYVKGSTAPHYRYYKTLESAEKHALLIPLKGKARSLLIEEWDPYYGWMGHRYV